MTLVTVDKSFIKNNIDFVIYNYLASSGEITAGKLVEDFNLKYGICMPLEKANEILSECVKSGILSPRFRHFVFLSC